MKLVLKVEIGDQFTWFATDVIPFEYESKDQFLYDLLNSCLESIKLKQLDFKFLGRDFNVLNFGYFKDDQLFKGFEFVEPYVDTLENWFHENAIKNS